MNDTMKGKVIVRYVDGTENVFEYERDTPAGGYSVVSQILKAEQLRSILLDLGDRMIVIPFSSVKAIEVSPTPEHLPGHAIRNVTLVS